MIPGMNSWRSSIFLCPATEWGVYFIYDEDAGELFAQRCEEGEWAPNDLEQEEQLRFAHTEIWCAQFGIQYCDTHEEAESIAKKYNVVF